MAEEAERTIGGNKVSLVTAMSEAILAMAGEVRLERVLRRLVDVATELVSAKYGALGIPDQEGEGFAEFIYTGMSDELVAQLGPLPQRHGLLAAMLSETAPYRTPDIRQDPRFQWWPDAHPQMSSFLGVPVVSRGSVIAAFYLSDKLGASQFSEADEEAIGLLAAHAAVAIESARLYERSRELSVVEERNRLARDLHDSVSQTLFSMTFTAEAALTAADNDPAASKAELKNLRDLSHVALEEMRSLIFELRPEDLAAEGLVPTLQKHIDLLRRTGRGEVTMTARDYVAQPPVVERTLYRIVQESLNNATKHAQAEHIEIDISGHDGRLHIVVTDDGVGFDTGDAGIRARRLGLTSMRERAEELGAQLNIESSEGDGTRVELELPLA